MLLTAFLIRWMNISYADSIYVNIMVLIGAFLFAQGLSVINYFLLKIKMKKFFRVLAYIFVFLTPQIILGVSTLGGIDIIFDLRKIKGAKSK